MAKGITKKTSGSGIAADGLNDVIFGLRGLEKGNEVRKELRSFHKELSKEVESKARAEAMRQKEQGGSVPKRQRGSMGFVGGGTDKTAHLDIRKTNKFARNLEFGRDYQFIPNLVVGPAKDGNMSTMSKTKRGAVANPMVRNAAGKMVSDGMKGSFYPAEKMKKRVYKQWIGTFWSARGGFPEGTKYGGYVAEKTIAAIVPGLASDYADEIHNLVKKTIKGKK